MASEQQQMKLDRQRHLRHNKLMRMIKQYTPTPQQIVQLLKIKQNTTIQISIRYRKSSSNHSYIFPFSKNQLNKNQNKSDEEDDDYPMNPEDQLYDLHSQNTSQAQITTKPKLLSFQIGKRVKSLDSEHKQLKNIQSKQSMKLKLQNSQFRLQNSQIKLSERQSSQKNFNFKYLPQINQRHFQSGNKLPLLKLKYQNCRTQSSKQQSPPKDCLLGKKLIKDSSLPKEDKAEGGIQKAIKKSERANSIKTYKKVNQLQYF